MDRAMRMMLAAGITLLVSGFAFMGYLGYLRSHPPTAGAADTRNGGKVSSDDERLSIPAFSLVDQDGNKQDRSILEGHVTVVWFMFTHCPLACPTMSMQAAEVQKQLRGSGVRFVAFSIDPANDTPAALKTYGDRFEIDWKTWTFLTEPDQRSGKRTGWDIFTNNLHQYAEVKPATPPEDSKPNQPPAPSEILHAVNFFLVGPDGNVLDQGWFNSNRPEDLKDLRERAIGAAKYYSEKSLLKP